jgi:hypothetical protein
VLLGRRSVSEKTETKKKKKNPNVKLENGTAGE